MSNGNGNAKDHSNERTPAGNDEPIATTLRLEGSEHSNEDNVQPLLRLEIITGPSRGRDFTIDGRTEVVRISNSSAVALKMNVLSLKMDVLCEK